MISLLFVGDGPRDSVTLPHLVAGILQSEVEAAATRHWKDIRLHRGSGYDKKLLFALRQAQDAGLAGVVAVVDRDKDKDGDRLKELQSVRERERTKAPPYPTALGHAIPHGEAWLLDDPVAVRTVLLFAGDVHVDNVRRTKDTKAALEALIDQSERAVEDRMALFEEMARLVVRDRCMHREDTGFEGFVRDVQSEFGDMAKTEEQAE